MLRSNQNKPYIGITTNQIILDNGSCVGQKRIYVNQEYVECVIKAGGIPFPIPINTSLDVIEQQVRMMDGLLFSGGQDINPLRYGEEPLNCLGEVCPDRDAFEVAMIKLASSLNKPILGICRGLQLINVAFGGTLYQDIGSQYPFNPIQHSQKSHRAAATHNVDIVPGSKLFSIFPSNCIITNSFHHQAVKDLAPGFIINARARDGIIEGIEMTGSHFLIGVQWHPEMMVERNAEMNQLFAALVDTAQQEKNDLGHAR